MTDLMPEPQISCLDDNTVQIKFGPLIGYVSSFHLIEPKLNQLKTAWLQSLYRPDHPASA